jgi:hypothetical protein
MSKDRNRDPRKDKDRSLNKDCRNTYGESPHGARKAIPKRKAIAHRQVRHSTKQDLALMDPDDDMSVDLAQSNATNDVHRVGTWKKQPDSPLGRQVEIGKLLRQHEDGLLDRGEFADLANEASDRWQKR